MDMLKRFFAYYAPYKALFALDFSCAVVSGLLELGFPMAVKAFVDDLLPGDNWGLIVYAACGLLAIYSSTAGSWSSSTTGATCSASTSKPRCAGKAFDHLQKLSFRFYDNQKTGHLVARVTKDLEEIGEVAHHGPEDLFIAIMTFIGAFVLMFIVHLAAGPDHRRRSSRSAWLIDAATAAG